MLITTIKDTTKANITIVALDKISTESIYLFLSIVEVRKLAQTDTWWLLVALIDVGHFRKQKG